MSVNRAALSSTASSICAKILNNAQALPEFRLSCGRAHSASGARRIFVTAGRLGPTALAVGFLALGYVLLAAAPGQAQTSSLGSLPPLPGYLPPYEISRIVRSAGFDPLAPPLREGTTFVVRATDFRGILMRVVVDAQSGAIRAVNRIVADSGPYGSTSMLPPPYGAPPRFGPLEFDGSEMSPAKDTAAPPPVSAPAPIAIHFAPHPLGVEFPPLPRPRPAMLASRKGSDDAKSAVRPAAQHAAVPELAAPSTAPAAAKKPPPIELPD
jgi:hypothetical protein